MSSKSPVVGQRDRADPAVARAEQHPAVLPQRLPQPAVPAPPLVAQHLQRGGHLGPRHRLGDELDPVVGVGVAHAPVDPQDQLEVLADAVGVEAADLDERRRGGNRPKAPLMRIRPPNRDQPVRPTRKARRYSTTWMRGSQVPRHARPSTMRPGDDPAAVDRPDGAAGGDHPRRVVGEGLGDPQQRVGLEDGVGVDHRDEGLGGGVDADVEGLGPAGVLLAHDDQAGPAVARHEQTPRTPRGRDVLRHVARQLDEVERLLQPRERGVGAAVVDDHDLVPGIPQREQRLHRGDDAGLLVVAPARGRDPGRQLAAEGVDDGLAAAQVGAEVQTRRAR